MEEKIKPPSIPEFFRIIWADWGSRVSGALSVPFTVAALLVNTNYAKVIWACLAVIAVAATVYQIWARERTRAVDLYSELSRERDQNRPKFSAEIEQTIVSEAEGFNGALGFLNTTIINNGAPSIAHKWEVTLTCNGTKHKATLHVIDAVIATPNGPLKITRRDAIWEKSVNPIPRHGMTRGWITVIVPGITKDIAGLPGAEWMVSFVDSLGVRCSASHALVREKMMENPQYYPGSFES